MLTITTFPNLSEICERLADFPAPVSSPADDELAQRVRLFLAARQVGELRQVAVTARQGRVRLSGRLSSFYHRQLAISLIQRVAGVLRVEDQLVVAARKPLATRVEKNELASV